MAYYPLERLMNLYDGYQKAFVVAGVPLLLVQQEGRCQLMVNQCPHQSLPLTQATIENGEIRCPYHGMCFDLNSGATLDGCDERLRFVPIAYEGKELGVVL